MKRRKPGQNSSLIPFSLFCVADFALRKGWSSPFGGCIRKLKMLKLNQTIAGMPPTGTSLERPEPCEAKVSRTVLRGARAG
jgi:hypothetical protein